MNTCKSTALAASFFILTFAIFTGITVEAESLTCVQTDFFVGGKDGYHTYRIPSLLVTKKGTVLAFCEGRKNSASDSGNIDIVQKSSTDGGQTWSKMQIIADDGDHCMGNHCPVIDKRTGAIFLPVCRNNKDVFLFKSTDDGITWSKPIEITKQIMKPGWGWIGTGPGHGIQLKSGRLIIPCWAGIGKNLHGQIQLSFVIYSDDGGKTWNRGGALNQDASDECEVVELVDGSLYMNMRSRHGKKQRAYSFSKDEGKTWSTVKHDARLPEPSCQGSIIRFTSMRHFHKNRILFACPATPTARTNMTVRVSYDECRNWPVSKVINSGYSGYSDLAVTNDGQILCLYETDLCRKITLARFNIEWLTDGNDSLVLK